MWYKFAQQNNDLILTSPQDDLSEEQLAENHIYDWAEESDQVSYQAMNDFINNPKSKQNWQVVPFARLQKIWNDYATTGIIRDEKGLQEIADLMVKNTMLLEFNTIMSGHTQQDPKYLVEQHAPEDMEWTDELDELHGDHIEDETGMWRISDFALEPLLKDAYELRFARTAEQKLHIIDRMLNRVHPRSDIAAMFIEGGSRNLSKLSGIGE